MGGRGASSGTSKAGNRYGSQYRTLMTVGNIKFVEAKTSGQAETLLETMADGRVYALVNRDNGNLKSVIFNGRDGKRAKRIDLDHFHSKVKPHAHDGYLGGEFRRELSSGERKIVDKIVSAWDSYKRKP